MRGTTSQQGTQGWPEEMPSSLVGQEVVEVIGLLRRRYPQAQVEALLDDEDGCCWQIDLPADRRVMLRAGRIFLMRGPLVADPDQEDDLPVPGRLVRVNTAKELMRYLAESDVSPSG